MYVKTMRIVYTQGIDAVDPFLLAQLVKPALGRDERAIFERDYATVRSYVDLIALCERYVELDDTKPVGTESPYGATRDVYNDTPDPWLSLLWKVAESLSLSTPTIDTWDIQIADSTYRGPSLYLRYRGTTYTDSPSVECEQNKYGPGKVVKIRTHPGLAMNTPLEKASADKIAAKLLEHGAKVRARLLARARADDDRLAKERSAAALLNRAKALVKLIEVQHGVPRYYSGSQELVLSATDVQMRVTPRDDGFVTVSITLTVRGKAGADAIAPFVELIGAQKKRDVAQADKAKELSNAS
jgi:hypothetical protein